MKIDLVFPNTVRVNGNDLTPAESQSVHNHSPDGFAWGYGGSGPSQLALALCLKELDVADALRCYQAFKWDHVAHWDRDGGGSYTVDFRAWHEAWKGGKR